MKNFKKVSLSCAISIAVGVQFPVPVVAQELVEIVVTATRREERLQDVPISVSSFTGELIQDSGFSDVEDMSTFIPNLYMNDGFTGQTITIRGIGTSASNEAFEQAVAQFHDGIYYGRDNLSQNAFFDLERVEVVRGPQPTFAGQSATAGAINVFSAKPGDETEGNATIAYGNDEEFSLEGGFGGPITDTFGLRVSGRLYELNDTGYKQLTTGDDLGTRDNKAFRAIGVWTPSPDFDVTLKYEYQNTMQLGTPLEFTRCETRPQFSVAHVAVTPGMPSLCAMDALYLGADLNTLDGVQGTGGSVDIWDAVESLNAASGAMPGDLNYWGDPASPVARNLNDVYEYKQPQERYTKADIFSSAINWQLNDLTLTSTTGYVTYDKKDWLDPDSSSFAIFADLRLEEFDQISQEIRLTSPIDQTLSWMVGAYWQEHDLTTEIDIFMPWLFFGADPSWTDGIGTDYVARGFGGILDEKSTWQSAFLSATWNIDDEFRFNFGGRYQSVEKNGFLQAQYALLPEGADRFDSFLPGQQLRDSIKSDDFLPEAGFQWDVTDQIMTYIKYAEAFKAGGFVMSPAIAGAVPDPFTFKPEEADGWELGVKGRFLDNSLELNVAYFDTDFTNLQVTTMNRLEGRFVTGNAASANTSGFEFDGRWAVTDNFLLGFNGAVTDAVFTQYDTAQCDSRALKNDPACVADYTGRSLVNSPDWSYGLTPEYFLPFGDFELSLSSNIVFRDEMVYRLGNDPLNTFPSMHRVDVRLALTPVVGDWELALYGRDITDERPQISAPDEFQSSSSDPTIFDANGVGRERGARWGIQARLNF